MTTVIIPAYKPDEKLLDLIAELKKQPETENVLVVNDGSGDTFLPIFAEAEKRGCTVLTHEQNRGKGAALKTAFAHCLTAAAPEDVFCTADADGQHLPKDILRCVRAAAEHKGELVLGSRAFVGDVPARSRFGNAVSRFTFRLLMGKRVYDTQTGLRAFTGDLLPTLLEVRGERYEYEMQMLCLFARRKMPIREITIETVYLEDNASSHFHAVRDAMRVYSILFKSFWERIRQPMFFLASSLFAFVLDVVFYWLAFNFLFPSVVTEEKTLALLSLLLARSISSVANYAINRKVVFHNASNIVKTFLLYVLLVVGVFFGNHFLNVLFLDVLGWHEVICLLLAQLICFPISFLVQKYLVFPNRK